VRDGSNTGPVEDVALLLQAASPQVVYTHNLADRHDTHVVTALRVIEAIRSLPQAGRPQRLYGCEVWRDLDWMADADRVVFDVSARQSLQVALLGVFDSQVGGGKRYDLATMARRRAHATYYASHEADFAAGLAFGMDLTPLIEDSTRCIQEYVQEVIDRFAQEVRQRLVRQGSRDCLLK